MNNLQVPDPGLLYKLEQLVTDVPEDNIYFDMKIVCRDGDFKWSRFLLGSVSAWMETLVLDVENTDTETTLFIPDVNKDILLQMLYSLISSSNMAIQGKSRISLLKMLAVDENFFQLQDVESEKIKITGVPMTMIPTISSKIKEEDDVDILFTEGVDEEFEGKRKKKSTRKMFCKICSLDFQTYSAYQDHINSHKNISGLFECNEEECGKTFKAWTHLSDHHYSHDKSPKPHLCSYCSYTSITRANIRKHEVAVHEDPDRRDFACDKCNKRFKTSSNLAEHQRVHGNEKYKCKECPKSFKSLIGFNQHKRTHTGQMFSCKVCDEQFQSKHSVNRHEKDIHGLFNSPIGHKISKCPKKGCSAEFSSEEDYRLHVKTAHQNKASILICPLCKKFCPTKVSLKQHFQKMHRESGERVVRGKSGTGIGHGVAVKSKSLLKLEKTDNNQDVPSPAVHQSVSTDSSRFACNCCSRKFKFKYQLLSHVADRTRGGHFCVVDTCPSGQQQFESVELLELHLRQHTGETSYHCDVCYKSYATRHARDKHVATHDPSPEQHTCPHCGLAQPNRLVLNMHAKYCTSRQTQAEGDIVIYVNNH